MLKYVTNFSYHMHRQSLVSAVFTIPHVQELEKSSATDNFDSKVMLACKATNLFPLQHVLRKLDPRKEIENTQ